jgi:hypothetical protein
MPRAATNPAAMGPDDRGINQMSSGHEQEAGVGHLIHCVSSVTPAKAQDV